MTISKYIFISLCGLPTQFGRLAQGMSDNKFNLHRHLLQYTEAAVAF